MRFLADESCDFVVVTTLRAAGHDVTAVAEICPGAKDSAVLGLARSQARILVSAPGRHTRRVSCRYVMDNPWTIGSGRGWIGVASGVRKPQENREQRYPAAPGCLVPAASGAKGHRFESCRARHLAVALTQFGQSSLASPIEPSRLRDHRLVPVGGCHRPRPRPSGESDVDQRPHRCRSPRPTGRTAQ